MTAQVPAKLRFLYKPHRFKVIYGGRGKGASWGMADALLIRGSERPLRWLCARETQESIDESVHAVLSARIVALKLERFYEIQRARIVSRTQIAKAIDGASDPLEGRCGFSFAGLKHNTAAIKSYDGFDGCWVEEAESVSHDSWRTLIPTLRKDGCNIHGSGKPEKAEIWVSFNPKFDTDATYQRFVVDSPTDCVSVFMSWRDNPFFPETLRIDMADLKARDYEEYEHVYEGKTLSAVQGAIYAEELKKATAEDRICSVPIDRTKQVETVWDLGFGDKMAIWFVQAYGGYFNFVDYLENNGKTMEWYVVQLQQRGYIYGTDWLPHDGADALLHRNLTGSALRSPEMIMRTLGRKVRIAPKVAVVARINAGRMVFPQCRFDRDRCDVGLRALKMYQWGPPSTQGIPKREPLHDAASHGADAFQVAAIALRQPAGQSQALPVPPEPKQPWAWMG